MSRGTILRRQKNLGRGYRPKITGILLVCNEPGRSIPYCAYLYCTVLCQIVSLQYLSRSFVYLLTGLPYRIFLSYVLQVVTREVHRSSLRRLIYPAQDRLIFLTLQIRPPISMTRVFSLPDPDVGISVLVCDVEHTSFQFGMCGRKLVL